MTLRELVAPLLAAGLLIASHGLASAQKNPTTAAECAQQRDAYKEDVAEFNKGVEQGRALVQQQARAAGKKIEAEKKDEAWRNPEALAAKKYQDCLNGLAKSSQPENGKAASQPETAARPSAKHPATPAEIAECRAEAGKLGAVFTLDTTTKEMTERKPDAADKSKYGGRIFAACLQSKGAIAPSDAGQANRPESATGGQARPATRRPVPVIVREGPEKKCDGSKTCSVAHAGCLRFCETKPDSTACPEDCRLALNHCLATGRWKTRNCEKTGMARE